MSRVPLSDAERRELHYAEVDRVYQEECRQRARDGSTGGRVQGQTAGPCVNCGSTRHKLNHCLPAPEGTIKGCTLCHTMSHCVDQCARFRNMSLKERVEILVLDRINMPALDTYNSWFHSFRDLSATPGQDNTVTLPGRFPWTSGYSRDISGNPDRLETLQAEFDQHRDKLRLPTDPATRDMDSVWHTFTAQGGRS